VFLRRIVDQPAIIIKIRNAVAILIVVTSISYKKATEAQLNQSWKECSSPAANSPRAKLGILIYKKAM